MVDVCKDADVTDLRRSLLKGFGVFQERHFSYCIGTTGNAGVVGGVVLVQCTSQLNFGTICWHVKMARENAEAKLLDMGYVLDN